MRQEHKEVLQLLLHGENVKLSGSFFLKLFIFVSFFNLLNICNICISVRTLRSLHLISVGAFKLASLEVTVCLSMIACAHVGFEAGIPPIQTCGTVFPHLEPDEKLCGQNLLTLHQGQFPLVITALLLSLMKRYLFVDF